MSRRLTLIVAGAALAVGGAIAAGLPAHAAVPAPASAGAPFTVLCPSGVRASLTLPAGGSFVVGSVDGRDDVLVPYRFRFRWTDGKGHVLARSEAQGESGAVPRDAVTCRLEPTAFPDGSVFSFSVRAVIRPA